MRRFIKKAITTPLVLLVALIIFLEEDVWEALKALMARVATWPPLAYIEHWVVNQNPYVIATILVLVEGITTPGKYIVVPWLMLGGHYILAAVVIILKVVFTLFVVRVFVITKPKLLQISWFAHLYHWIIWLRNTVFSYLKSLPLWKRAVALKVQIREWMHTQRVSVIVSRWRAIFRKRSSKR